MTVKNLLFFDCETGGLSPRKADMVEAAWILTDPSGREVLSRVALRIFPKRPVDRRAAAVNGYNPWVWQETAHDLQSVMDCLLADAQDACFVAHNAPFDWRFVEAALVALDRRWTGSHRRFCTRSAAAPLQKAGRVGSVKLEELTRYFGIPHVAHRAAGDIEATRQVYLRLRERYPEVLTP